MAVLATSSITLAQTVDIESVTWYYKLQASTDAVPAKPTTETPSGWGTTEPTYTEGSTNSLYVCEKTIFSDGTFAYSDVSLSSSYEAAKTAYNKSVQAKNTADAALADAVEYVIGTQTAKTGAWTGVTRDVSLTVGKTIAYKLPYAGDGEATLTLTLAGGGITEAVPIYLNTTRVTTHFGAGSVINMTYDGTSWRASSIPNTNTNNYDRRLHNSAIKAAAAVTKAHLIAGTAAGYKNLAASLAFDLAYPILYASAAISANATAKTAYEAYPDVNFSTTGAIESGTAAKILWLKGTVEGNTFTIAASNWLTTIVPAEEDGMYYIPLGVMSSATAGYFATSNRLYAYLDGAFQPADTAAVIRAEEASKVATKYVTDQTDGIFVHPEGEGPNDTATPTGWKIRDALEMLKNGVSLFKAWVENNITKVRIGRDDSAHFLIQDGKIAGYGDSTNIYFETGNSGNTAQQTYYSDGSTQYFNVLMATSLTSVTVNGTAVSATLQNSSLVKLASIPASGTTVVITYVTSLMAPYFTFGTRDSGTIGIGSASFGNANKAPGIYATAEGDLSVAGGFASHAEGSQCEAYGAHSHAEGRECVTWGDNSHAGGNLSEAHGDNSFAYGQNVKTTGAGAMACGKYNYPTSVLFGVGDGNGENARSNAFSVGESGNCFVKKRLMSGTPSASSSDYRPMFKVADKTFSSLSIPAGDRMSSAQTKSVAETGYTPIAVTSFGMSGTNSYKCCLYSTTFSGNNIIFNIYNTGSSAVTASIRFSILYIATDAL